MGGFLLTVFASGLAFAAGGGGHHDGGIPLREIGIHALNFVILLSLLAYFVGPKIKDALANRAVGIKKTIDDANAQRKDAREQFAELEQRLSGFEQQLETMRADSEVEAGKERDAILARAEEDARRVREGAQRTIKDEAERAKQALRAEAAVLAVNLAEEHLRSAVGDDDQKRLAGDFFEAVNSGGRHG